MFYMGFWVAIIVAIIALVSSLNTRRRLEQEISRLEQLLKSHIQQVGQQELKQPLASQHINPPDTATTQIPIAISSDNLSQQNNLSTLPSSVSVAANRASEPINTPVSTSNTNTEPDKTSNKSGWPLSSAQKAHLEPDEHSLNIVTSIWHSLQQWFKGGNAIVRIGVLILLVGVVLLLRLANELFTISIEVRLGAVALGGVGLTLLGLRLRHKRYGYAISLQGAGLAIVYFTLFAAFRLYQVLPPSLTFGLLAILAVVSAALALMQNALPLAVLAFGGAFLAPLLTSSGSNNLVGLFGYYLILNLALAWLAHYKTWKVLNVLGAVMTFGVAGYVGWNSYETSMRWPLEGLLLAHLALYLFIVVRYSQQLVSNLSQSTANTAAKPALATVDSTLLFGVPLMGFALQAGLLRDIPYALAISSAGLSAIYLLLGYQLFYRNKNLVLLTEGVLALGVGFMALVIPLALDAKWTAVGWAVQGTALVWLGKRQQRIWSTRFGLLLLGLTAITIVIVSLAAQRAIGLPLLVYAICLFISALLLRKPVSAAVHTEPKRKLKVTDIGSFLLLVVAFVASQFTLREFEDWIIEQQVYWPFTHLTLGFYPLVFAAMTLLAGWRLDWPALNRIHRLIVLWLTVYAGLIWLDYGSLASNKEQLWLLAAGFALFGAILLWRQKKLAHQIGSTTEQRFIAAVWIIGLLIFTSTLLQLHWIAQPIVAAIIVPLIILLYLLLVKNPLLPIQREQLLADIALPVTVALLGWMLFASWFSNGQMLGLVYVPLINLLDNALIVSGFVVYRLSQKVPSALKPVVLGGLGLAAFVALTGMVIRTLHQWAGTPLIENGAWHSDLVQTSLTIVWTLCALLLTGVASKFAWRQVWLVGIALLAVVVIKLLLIDLSNAATIARIVSFIGAGLIMLLIGYIAPLPPAIAQPKNFIKDDDHDQNPQ